ncbi:MAG: nucleotidyltransferase domain-containing protein [Candidatus Methanoperedens sp.]|nr:nucleotidyltransferase domain-containing protein [Candidatus Methanoperedens sp.]
MENILGTRTAIKIVSCLLKNPHKEFKEIDLIKESKVGKGAGADAINRLYSSNILTIKRAGKTKIIQLNTLNPVTFAIRQLFDQYKFLTLPETRISAISLFKEKVCSRSKAIILFGSLAAGTYDENSDIDLLVIIDHEKEIEEIKKVINEIHELVGEYINVHFLNSNEARNEFNKNELIRTALINGILVYGGDHVREIMKSPDDLKELISIKERINAAMRNYANKDYELTKEIVLAVVEDMAFLVCTLEGMNALSRKDAFSKIDQLNEYKVLTEIDRLEVGNMLEVLEDIYIKIFNRKILKGEFIER